MEHFTSEQKKEFDHQIKADSKSGLAGILEKYYGIKVPKRFSFEEAQLFLNQNPSEDILWRTGLGALDEGYNGILPSVLHRELLQKGEKIKSLEDINKKILGFFENSKELPSAAKLYCKYTRTPLEEFKKNFSLIGWKYEKGWNVTGVADDTTNRIYLFAACKDMIKHCCIMKDGVLTEMENKSLSGSNNLNVLSPVSSERLKNKLCKIPDIYSKVRNALVEIGQTPTGVKNASLMEFQISIDDYEIYFLQSTKGVNLIPRRNNFNISQETLKEVKKEKNIAVAEFVRGQTDPKDAKDFRRYDYVLISPPFDWKIRAKLFNIFEPQSGMCYSFTGDKIFNELSYPYLKIQLFNSEGYRTKEDLFIEVIKDHHVRSGIFKTDLFVSCDFGKLMSSDEIDKAYTIAWDKKMPVYFNLEVLSDGENAFVRRGKNFEDGSPLFVPSYDIGGEKNNEYIHRNLYPSLIS